MYPSHPDRNTLKQNHVRIIKDDRAWYRTTKTGGNTGML